MQRTIKAGMASVLALGAFAGSALAREAPPPPPGSPSAFEAFVSTRALNENERFGGTVLEHNPNFSVSGGRGSAALGMAFGVIGVAANIGHIRAVNRERGATLASVSSTDPRAALSELLAANASETPAAAQYELAPVVLAHFDSETSFVMMCGIYASLPGERRRGWRGRYLVYLDGVFDTQNEQSMADAAAKVAPCLAEAHRVFALHLAGADTLGEPQRIQSGTFVMTHRLYQNELAAERFVGADPFGVISYQRTPLRFFPEN